MHNFICINFDYETIESVKLIESEDKQCHLKLSHIYDYVAPVETEQCPKLIKVNRLCVEVGVKLKITRHSERFVEEFTSEPSSDMFKCLFTRKQYIDVDDTTVDDTIKNITAQYNEQKDKIVCLDYYCYNRDYTIKKRGVTYAFNKHGSLFNLDTQ